MWYSLNCAFPLCLLVSSPDESESPRFPMPSLYNHTLLRGSTSISHEIICLLSPMGTWTWLHQRWCIIHFLSPALIEVSSIYFGQSKCLWNWERLLTETSGALLWNDRLLSSELDSLILIIISQWYVWFTSSFGKRYKNGSLHLFLPSWIQQSGWKTF